MAIKDKAQVRKIGHLKVAVGFLLIIVIGSLMWYTASLGIDYPTVAIYRFEFFILVVILVVSIAASNRIIDKVYSGKKG
jgi:hypothetical protein